MEESKCIICGNHEKICCDDGYYYTQGGRIKHVDPVCVNCCNCDKDPIWEGKTIGSGICLYAGQD